MALKVLFFYQHFWPDSPPYANMLRAISSELANRGKAVSVVTAAPAYKSIDRDSHVPQREIVDGVKVTRLSLLPGSKSSKLMRVMSKAIWPVRAAFYVVCQRILGKKPDIVVAATIPPVVNGLFGLIAAKLSNAKFVYHLQDIYPEIAATGGLWNEGSFKYRVLKRLDTWVCKRADLCVVLSKDMANSLVVRGVESQSINIINNFMLEHFDQDSSGLNAVSHRASDSKVRMVFAGNLGRFQGLEEIVKSFKAIQPSADNLELHFVGEGAVEDELKILSANSNNIYFHGHMPFEEACVFLQSFDVGIVSIQSGIYRYAYPSKTLTYLGLGLPILAFIEKDSELAKTIKSNQLGVCANSISHESLTEGFSSIAEYCSSEANNTARIKAFVENNTSFRISISQWDAALVLPN